MTNWTNEKENLDRMRELAVRRIKELLEEREQEYYKNPKLCKHCGKPLPYKDHNKKTFCNSSCSATYHNLRRNSKVRKKFKTCECCGKVFEKKPKETWQSFNSRQFCCPECRYKKAQDDYIRDWKNGKIHVMSDDIPDRIRNYLLEKANYQCSKCGWHEVNKFTGKVPLEIHHIDGNPYNNSEDNLEVVCPNCHSLTSNFKSNKGDGRYVRKKNSLERTLKLKELDKDV